MSEEEKNEPTPPQPEQPAQPSPARETPHSLWGEIQKSLQAGGIQPLELDEPEEPAKQVNLSSFAEKIREATIAEAREAAAEVSLMNSQEVKNKAAVIDAYLGKEDLSYDDKRIMANMGDYDKTNYLYTKTKAKPEYQKAVADWQKKSAEAEALTRSSGTASYDVPVDKMTNDELLKATGFGERWMGAFGDNMKKYESNDY